MDANLSAQELIEARDILSKIFRNKIPNLENENIAFETICKVEKPTKWPGTNKVTRSTAKFRNCKISLKGLSAKRKSLSHDDRFKEEKLFEKLTAKKNGVAKSGKIQRKKGNFTKSLKSKIESVAKKTKPRNASAATKKLKTVSSESSETSSENLSDSDSEWLETLTAKKNGSTKPKNVQKKNRKTSEPRNASSATNSKIDSSESSECLSEIDSDFDEDGVRIFKCNYCSFTCKVRSNLRTHRQTHTHKNAKRFNCQTCDYSTRFKYNLKLHEVKHTEKRQFPCNQCNRKFARKDVLKKHELTIHAGDGPLRCNKCFFACSKETDLRKHVKIHSETVLDKPFDCKLCDRKYTSKKSLLDHQLKHAGPRSNVFKCEDCARTFARKGNLISHKRVHNKEVTMISCSECSYTCVNQWTMRKHSRIHAKKWNCDECEAVFDKEILLNTHKRKRHTKSTKRRFQCVYCDESFTRRGNLDNHNLEKHTKFLRST